MIPMVLVCVATDTGVDDRLRLLRFSIVPFSTTVILLLASAAGAEESPPPVGAFNVKISEMPGISASEGTETLRRYYLRRSE